MKTEASRYITCILPNGRALAIIESLEKEKGLVSANLGFARGTSTKFECWGGDGEEVEKDILDVVVPESRSEEIFAFLYEAAEIDSAYGAFMYMGCPIRAVPYVLPDIPAEPQE